MSLRLSCELSHLGATISLTLRSALFADGVQWFKLMNRQKASCVLGFFKQFSLSIDCSGYFLVSFLRPLKDRVLTRIVWISQENRKSHSQEMLSAPIIYASCRQAIRAAEIS